MQKPPPDRPPILSFLLLFAGLLFAALGLAGLGSAPESTEQPAPVSMARSDAPDSRASASADPRSAEPER